VNNGSHTLTDKETPSAVASHRIASLIRDQILDGSLAPGERIRQEEFAERFGASRIPVKEALRLLESDGLVTLVANTGAWVSRMSEEECVEAYQIRERLEPLLLRESLKNLDEATIDALDALAAEMEAGADVETFLRLDRQFHLLSYSAARTTALAEIIQRLWNSTQHYRRAYTLLVGIEHNQISHSHHHLIVDALRRRDPDDAESALVSHIRRTRSELSRHPEVFG
jgi:DNA-binding GntR family transcriptional regulator